MLWVGGWQCDFLVLLGGSERPAVVELFSRSVFLSHVVQLYFVGGHTMAVTALGSVFTILVSLFLHKNLPFETSPSRIQFLACDRYPDPFIAVESTKDPSLLSTPGKAVLHELWGMFLIPATTVVPSEAIKRLSRSVANRKTRVIVTFDCPSVGIKSAGHFLKKMPGLDQTCWIVYRPKPDSQLPLAELGELTGQFDYQTLFSSDVLPQHKKESNLWWSVLNKNSEMRI